MSVVSVVFTVMRMIIGLLFFGHGSQKLFGWFEGNGWPQTVKMTESMKFWPANFWAGVLALSEFVGGICLFLGFLTPIAAALIIGVMIMAILKVHAPKGLWNSQGGFEFPLVVIAAATLIGVSDPGIYSLDHALGITWPNAAVFGISVVVVIVGVVLGVLTTVTQPSPQIMNLADRLNRPRRP